MAKPARTAASREPEKNTLVDLLGEADALFDLLNQRADSLGRELAAELRRIGDTITATRDDIRKLGTGDIAGSHIPRAGLELQEVVRATEDATNTIMSAAETILGADTTDILAYQSLVTDKVMEIFEACSFQDITGQRVGKVVQTLIAIETRIAALTGTIGLSSEIEGDADIRSEREKALLLNGPALTGQAIRQTTVDDLFQGCGVVPQGDIDTVFEGGETSQDDIDALFD